MNEWAPGLEEQIFKWLPDVDRVVNNATVNAQLTHDTPEGMSMFKPLYNGLLANENALYGIAEALW